MHRKKDCWWQDEENYVPPKQSKKSSELTPKEKEEFLKTHFSIYSAQKRLHGPLDEENSSASTPIATPQGTAGNETISELPQNKNNTQTREAISDLYENRVRRLKETLAREAVSVCLTFDFCDLSKKLGQNYIAITAHYINKDFVIKHMLLEFKPVVPLDGPFLLSQLKKISNIFNIETKVIHIVTKYSQLMEKTIGKLQLCNLSHCSWCFIESLNQAIGNALKPVQYLFEKMRATANHINKNRAAKEFFYDYQKRLNNTVEPKILHRPTMQCWKSKYILFQQFTTLKDPVVASLKVIENTCPVIDEKEWDIAKQLCQVLKPFVDVNSFLSDKHNPLPSSMLIVLIDSLKSICNKVLQSTDNELCHEVVTYAVKSLKNDMVNVFDTELDEFGKSLGVCTFLDPRFKIYGFQNDNAVSRVKKHVHELVVDLIEKNDSGTREQRHDEDILAWKVFDKYLETVKPSTNDRATQEINMYIDAELLPRKGPDGKWNDPAQWWREHKAIFPNLSEIYRFKCPIVGTAVQCKELVLCAADLLEEHASKATLEQLAFLHINQKWE